MPGAPALPCRCWRPPPGAPQAWACLALLHGLGSHSGCFEDLATELARHGLILCAIDLPGHGLAPGRRGDVRDWGTLHDAVQALLEVCADQAPGLPRVLLGHSLGGTLALDVVRCHPHWAQATVVANPALALRSGWQLALAQLLVRLWPGCSLPTGFPLAAAAADPAVLERIRRDPLRHDRCSARLAVAWQRVCNDLIDAASTGVGPLLVLLSSADPLVCPTAVRQFVARLPASTVRLKLYGASRHELFDDRERQTVITDLLGWLREVVDAGEGA